MHLFEKLRVARAILRLLKFLWSRPYGCILDCHAPFRFSGTFNQYDIDLHMSCDKGYSGNL